MFSRCEEKKQWFEFIQMPPNRLQRFHQPKAKMSPGDRDTYSGNVPLLCCLPPTWCFHQNIINVFTRDFLHFVTLRSWLCLQLAGPMHRGSLSWEHTLFFLLLKWELIALLIVTLYLSLDWTNKTVFFFFFAEALLKEPLARGPWPWQQLDSDHQWPWVCEFVRFSHDVGDFSPCLPSIKP